jgi:hypothetical protein
MIELVEDKAVTPERVEFLRTVDGILNRWADISREISANMEAFERAFGMVWEEFSTEAREEILARLEARRASLTRSEGDPFTELVEALAAMESHRQAQLLEELRSGAYEARWGATKQ